jgi:NAD(P)-dependent dehydrogenase (short-subunit alcohol dehydrogenase family)
LARRRGRASKVDLVTARATDWDPRHLPDLTGRRYLVTGSTAGIGYFACEQLARAGAHVVATGRNPNRLVATKRALLGRVPGASVETLLIDTSNLGSLRAAAATARAGEGLDGLLLNAGMVHPPKKRETTLDGNELVFATNALGHFALAGELLTALARREGRMVWVGSMSTTISPYDPVDPQLTKDYSAWRAYVQSKVATTALGLEAARRLEDAAVSVASLVAHPGYSIGGRTPGIAGVNEPSRIKRFADNLQAPFTQSKERGAWPLVAALADPGARSGEFWGPRALMKGAPRRARPSRVTRDPAIAERLWRFCEEATRVRWPFARAARP